MAPIHSSFGGADHDQGMSEQRADRQRTLLRIAYLRHRQLELARRRKFIESAEFALEARRLAQSIEWSVWG